MYDNLRALICLTKDMSPILKTGNYVRLSWMPLFNTLILNQVQGDSDFLKTDNICLSWSSTNREIFTQSIFAVRRIWMRVAHANLFSTFYKCWTQTNAPYTSGLVKVSHETCILSCEIYINILTWKAIPKQSTVMHCGIWTAKTSMLRMKSDVKFLSKVKDYFKIT